MVIGILAQFCCTWAGRSDQVSVSWSVGMRVHVLSNSQSCCKAEIILKSKIAMQRQIVIPRFTSFLQLFEA